MTVCFPLKALEVLFNSAVLRHVRGNSGRIDVVLIVIFKDE
jgi:hypothetical protein